MRVLLAAAVVVLLLGSVSALAATFYQYHDKETGRDVYVNRLDQVPPKYRSQAKVVLESTGPETAADDTVVEQSKAEPSKIGELAKSASSVGVELQKAAQSKNVWRDAPDVVRAIINVKMAQKGQPPLTDAEGASLATLISSFMIALPVAGLLAFALWIWLIVDAFRSGHLVWGILMILISPVSYVYLFIHFCDGRPLHKLGCALGLLSPTLVSLVVAWRFYAWLQGVIEARGGHL